MYFVVGGRSNCCLGDGRDRLGKVHLNVQVHANQHIHQTRRQWKEPRMKYKGNVQ